MYIDKELNKIIFFSNNCQGYSYKETEFNLKDIEKTIISKSFKKIIQIHQAYKKYKIKSRDHQLDNHSNQDIDLKYLINKYFMLTLQLINGLKIDLILLTFDEFKNWLNGFAIVIKSNKKCLNEL